MTHALRGRLLTGARRATWLVLLACAGCVPGVTPLANGLELFFNTGDADAATTAGDQAVFRSEPVFDSISDKIGSHAPTLTVLPDGELLAAWYSYDGPHELDGSAIYMARRPADSEQWEPAALHVDRTEGDGNPVLYSEGDDVWLFQAVVPLGWSTSRVEVQKSADRGYTWTAARSLGGTLGTNVRYAPVRTDAGTLLLPAYDDLLQRSLFYTSDDGDDWTLTAVLADPPHALIQPSVARLESGRLLAAMRSTSGWLAVSASDNDGANWSPPQDSGFANPGSPAALLRLDDGNLVLILNEDDAARTPLSIRLSTDEGLTWSAARSLVSGEGEYAYPAAVQTADGHIHVLYSHDRERIQHIELNEAWIVAGAGD